MSSHLSEHDAGFEDFLVLDSHSIDHEPEYSQSSRSAGGISRPKQWSTSLALVIIQGCADYCTLMNWDRFDLNEASVDWEQWSSIVKWPAEPRPIGMCIKKIKDIHHQWVCTCSVQRVSCDINLTNRLPLYDEWPENADWKPRKDTKS